MCEYPKEIYCEQTNGIWYVKDKATKIILVEDMEESPAKELVRRWNSQPDLLEACKSALEFTVAYDIQQKVVSGASLKLQDAIAKATHKP